MEKFITPEIAGQIAKIFLEWGTPGVIILFLIEERRRLMKEVAALQKRLMDSIDTQLETNKKAFETVADNKSAIDRMTQLLNNFLMFRGFSKGDTDV